MPEIVFGMQSYESRSLPLSAQRMLNCCLESQPQGTKSQVPIFGAPGLTEFAALPTFPVRGLWNYNGNMWAVSGDSLYRLNSAGGFKKIGSGIGGTAPVQMADNGVQIIVVEWRQRVYCSNRDGEVSADREHQLFQCRHGDVFR